MLVQTKSPKPGDLPTRTRMFHDFSGHDKADWPPAALIVPGNTVTFAFQTASDYNEKKDIKYRWGFRCVVKGYVDSHDIPSAVTASSPQESMVLTRARVWLNGLESQLGSFGAVCAGNLIAGGEATTQLTDPAGEFERKNGYDGPASSLALSLFAADVLC